MKIVLFLLLALSLCSCASVEHHTQAVIIAPQAAQTVQPALVVATQVIVIPKVTPELKMPYTDADVQCIAKTMYLEARGEKDRGMIAVGYIITNRVASGHFPPTACGVVAQGKTNKHGRLIRNRCQFSWQCDGKAHPIHDHKTYARAQELAKLVLLKVAPNPVGRSMFFHKAGIRMRLAKAESHRIRVGHQIFFSLASL